MSTNHTKFQVLVTAHEIGKQIRIIFGDMKMDIVDRGDRYVIVLGEAAVSQKPDFPYQPEAANDT